MIGIYGGTFDPVHFGHLRTAVEVYEAVGLDELRFIPCHIPPHREKPGASAAQRLAMLEAAIQDCDSRFLIDTRELQRPGASYMVDTLSSIRVEVGDDVPVILIVGQDAFLGLHRWHQWQRLFTLAHIVVMQRPGYPTEPELALGNAIASRLSHSEQNLRDLASGVVCSVAVTPLGISANGIRRAIREHRSPRYLAPDAVLDLIKEQGLYQDQE